MSTTEVTASSDDRRQALIVVGAMAVLMWVLEIIDQVSGGNLDQYGIKPHAADGLVPGLVSAPVLHAGFGHLEGNTLPFLLLGGMIALSGLRRVLLATVTIALVGGLGVWIFASSGTDHIGASGLVFGYAAYLIARGFFTRSLLHFAVGVLVIGVYGTTLLVGVAPRDGISWQGHLFGAGGGVGAAWLVDARRVRQEPDPLAGLR